ncbi:autotransporter assembly complex protein TamA [Pacificibacter marinus]|uniref:Translocation and assembly module TamA n=1 Tax=Pacificibacter marinus TaxID=658057 RepID=A0A1Y5SEJ1_9RHOB|nr:BamA/TamA family outer membrane protein [Pacificibacter marinus]SEK52561.1 autotransporter secretion outer membrane protein TamA [Pacificibacter marinus]SLN38531.1 Translocation and assembly module TamA precursor [Pacificibacter marinus]
MTFRSILIATALWAGLSVPAFGFEATLTTTASGSVRNRLSAASSVLEAERDEITQPSDIIAAVQSDYRSLLGALYKSGYYAPVVRISVDGREGSTLSLITLPERISKVVISVDTGPKFTFGTAKIAPVTPETLVPLEFSTGKTARSGAVGTAKDAAIDGWRAAGHPKATLTDQSIVADHNTNTLNVDLGIGPGPKATFGELRFAGTKRVSPKRLEKITGAITGKTFDPELLDTAAARLRRTGAFRSVSITEADSLNADDSLDILATVTDAAPRRLGFGAEIDSLEGGTLSAYWLHRNISGKADRLRFDAEIGGLGSSTGVDYSIKANYRRPALTRPALTLIAEAEVSHLDEPNYLSDLTKLMVVAEKIISEHSYFNGGIGFRYSDVTDDVGQRNFSHVIFPIEGERDYRDNVMSPTSGTYFYAQIMPYLGLSGSESGARFYADGRGYLGFGNDDRFVFAARILAGSIVGSDTTTTPPDLLFYSGGGGTVRGQPYQSLNVDLGGGTETGGTSFVGLSTELRAGINEKLSLVGFADLGGIGANAIPDDTMNWHAGAGLGLRYDTGFGPIRLDIAAPVSGSTGDGVQIYVGIGQAF